MVKILEGEDEMLEMGTSRGSGDDIRPAIDLRVVLAWLPEAGVARLVVLEPLGVPRVERDRGWHPERVVELYLLHLRCCSVFWNL